MQVSNFVSVRMIELEDRRPIGICIHIFVGCRTANVSLGRCASGSKEFCLIWPVHCSLNQLYLSWLFLSEHEGEHEKP